MNTQFCRCFGRVGYVEVGALSASFQGFGRTTGCTSVTEQSSPLDSITRRKEAFGGGMRELGHRSSPERNRGRLSSEAFCYMCTATAGHFFTSPQASPALSRLYNVSRQHQQSDREMRSEDEPWSSPLLRSSIVPHLQVFPHLSRLNLGESTGGWGGLKNGLLSVAFRCSKCPISEDIGPSSLLPPPDLLQPADQAKQLIDQAAILALSPAHRLTLSSHGARRCVSRDMSIVLLFR